MAEPEIDPNEPLPTDTGDDAADDYTAGFSDKEQELNEILAKAAAGRGDPEEDASTAETVITPPEDADDEPAPSDTDPVAPAPAPGAPAEGAGGALPADSALAPPTGTEAGASPAQSAPAGEEYISIGGKLYPKSQEQDLAALIQWATEQIMAAPAPGQAPAQQAPTQQAPAAPVFDPNEFVDPALARVMDERMAQIQQANAPLEQKLDALLARDEQRAHAERNAQINQLDVAVATAKTAMATKYQLSPDELARLEDATRVANIVPAFTARPDMVGKPPEELFEAALDAMYWATPEFRERNVAQLVAAGVADEVQTQTVATKKSKAGALAGRAGAVSRTPPPKSNMPLTPDQQTKAAMAQALRAVQDEAV